MGNQAGGIALILARSGAGAGRHFAPNCKVFARARRIPGPGDGGECDVQTRRGPAGRLVGGAGGEPLDGASLLPGAWKSRATGSRPIDVQPDIATVLAGNARPMSSSTRCTGRLARTARSRGCSRSCAFPTPIPACSPRRWRCTRTRRKSIMQAAGVPVPEGVVVNRHDAGASPRPAAALRREAGQRGLLRRRDHRARGPHPSAPGTASRGLALRRQVLVEKYIPGRELTCAVMGDKALGVIEIRPATGVFYDYDAKYVERGLHSRPPGRN